MGCGVCEVLGVVVLCGDLVFGDYYYGCYCDMVCFGWVDVVWVKFVVYVGGVEFELVVECVCGGCFDVWVLFGGWWFDLVWGFWGRYCVFWVLSDVYLCYWWYVLWCVECVVFDWWDCEFEWGW